jgi:hypothetical protein
MDQKLRQEFQIAFPGKNYDEEQVEKELFRIAMENKVPVTVVILNFYDWLGIFEGKKVDGAN